jgi:VIT1/CCC1 family predicted Fe2+/Mn2+ transporter
MRGMLLRMKKMKDSFNHSLTTGFSFGLTSATITTLGLMVGLTSGTNSRLVVLGGIITIAVADAFSDALGIHISEESEGKHNSKEIWAATISTFLAKFLFALTFTIPVLLLDLWTAMFVCIAWGFLVLATLSYKIGRSDKRQKPLYVVAEHMIIAVIVVFVTYYLGLWIYAAFGT